MSRQKIPLLTLTYLSAAVLAQYQLVAPSGAVATPGGPAIGAAATDAAAIGDAFALDVMGTATLRADGAITKGMLLEVGAAGKATEHSTGVLVAMALEAAADGQPFEALQFPHGYLLNNAKLARIQIQNDITELDDDGALVTSGVNRIVGGEGIAGLTLAAPVPGDRCEIYVHSLTSGDVVVTTGVGVTIEATNDTATFNAAAERLILGYGGANNWSVIQNVGAVVLSAA